MIAALQVGLFHLGFEASLAREVLFQPGRQLHVDLTGNRARYLTLQREHVTQIAFVASRPQMLIGPCVDKLRRHAHAVARACHCAFDDGVDIQLASDLGQRLLHALEPHDGCPGNDAHASQLGEVRNQLVGHSVREIVLR